MAGPEAIRLQHTHVRSANIYITQSHLETSGEDDVRAQGACPELVGSHQQEKLPATEKGQCDLHTWLSILPNVSENHLDSY